MGKRREGSFCYLPTGKDDTIMDYLTMNQYLESGAMTKVCPLCSGKSKQMFGRPCFFPDIDGDMFGIARKFYCKSCSFYELGVYDFNDDGFAPQVLKLDSIENESDYLDAVMFTCQTKYQYNFWKKHLSKSNYHGNGLWVPEVLLQVGEKSFFVDFLNLQTNIAIELDDASHEGKGEKDRQRDLLVKSMRITTVRLNI